LAWYASDKVDLAPLKTVCINGASIMEEGPHGSEFIIIPKNDKDKRPLLFRATPAEACGTWVKLLRQFAQPAASGSAASVQPAPAGASEPLPTTAMAVSPWRPGLGPRGISKLYGLADDPDFGAAPAAAPPSKICPTISEEPTDSGVASGEPAMSGAAPASSVVASPELEEVVVPSPPEAPADTAATAAAEPAAAPATPITELPPAATAAPAEESLPTEKEGRAPDSSGAADDPAHAPALKEAADAPAPMPPTLLPELPDIILDVVLAECALPPPPPSTLPPPPAADPAPAVALAVEVPAAAPAAEAFAAAAPAAKSPAAEALAAEVDAAWLVVDAQVLVDMDDDDLYPGTVTNITEEYITVTGEGWAEKISREEFGLRVAPLDTAALAAAEAAAMAGVAADLALVTLPTLGASVLVDMDDEELYPATVTNITGEYITVTGEGWADKVALDEWNARVKVAEAGAEALVESLSGRGAAASAEESDDDEEAPPPRMLMSGGKKQSSMARLFSQKERLSFLEDVKVEADAVRLRVGNTPPRPGDSPLRPPP